MLSDEEWNSLVERTTVFSDEDWGRLISKFKNKTCVPFIGAGACSPTLPTAREIAIKWAHDYGYPLEDLEDLAAVTQYMSIKNKDPVFPKWKMKELIQSKKLPDFSAYNEPHAALAHLNVPVYITTNYDDFMEIALERAGKEPETGFCRWNNFSRDEIPKFKFESPKYKASADSPLVYHLHGSVNEPRSMVLTERDYINFLLGLYSKNIRLPAVINYELKYKSLLFMGYSLSDWNFRILFRSLMSSVDDKYSSVAIQYPAKPTKCGNVTDESMKRLSEYLMQYLKEMNDIELQIYWANVWNFCGSLRKAWDDA